ncbi:substrate-binding domain-containing protein [Paenibacillus beijingensis]|uniref:GntR family transcriptional regulator n=1 Tax=Paenibacillus beijingensis TaxID=1126833 RepID=A0A0D5NFH2_9BACL|nr:GntR family transcriptional regulator [Paenibacillus beijingensis]AJY74016.1 GntR family transcriptional regulator [Paenibacillus beijingensis]
MKNAPRGKKSNQQLYMQMADKVKTMIRTRNLKAHDPVPSEGELAKLFGVSRMTSKLALDQLAQQGIVYRLSRRGTFLSPGQAQPEVADGRTENGVPLTTREKGPHEEIAAAGQQPEDRKKHLQIAIIFPHLMDYTSRIIRSLEKEAREHDCDLILKITKDNEDEDECLSRLVAEGAAGIILFPRRRATCSDQVLRLKLARYPIVIIDRFFREIQIDCVYHDHFMGSYAMAEYLIGRGHREIGYITNPMAGVTSTEDRYHGYVQALLDHGIPVNNQHILIRSEDCDPERVNESNHEQEAFLRANPHLTAVMCGDDYVALQTLYTALHLNVAVPRQLSVVGFSDIQISRMAAVPLTTVRQPTGQLAQSALNLLLDRIGNSGGQQLTIKIQTAIVERASTTSRLE